ncbi:MAG TPA: (2Fe-2S)-binding protein [Candidatus Edwardsbacteria bacterium]|nr:(2Fe-2S)-binding protein [Candidatus Edwardsbacteria bacterium]
MITYINGRKRGIVTAELDRNLLAFLREDCDLTGAKNGCGIGACGACTVLVNNQPVRACIKTVADIVEKNVLTIEGLAREDGALHPLQQAFIDAGAIQCGFCTPGMVLTAHALLMKNHQPTREQIRTAISANICRCTGYQQIIDAIAAAAQYYQ